MNKSITRRIIAVAIIVGALGLAIWEAVTDGPAAAICVGAVLGWGGMVVGFYFGVKAGGL